MEILINGAIEQETVNLFNELEGDITIKLNSYGGDISSALTIYNRLRNHEGHVEVIIEGIAASAATIIACRGRVKMAVNGLYMIHSPLLELYGDFNSEELNKRITALRAIEGVMVDIYSHRTGLSTERIREMMNGESWFTAIDAKSLCFVDEIIEEIATADATDNGYRVNDLIIPAGRFKNTAALEQMAKYTVQLKEGVKGMDNQTLLGHVKAFFGRDKSEHEIELEAEVERLKAELAQARADIKTTEEIYALIADNIKSGAPNVKGSVQETIDAKDAAIQRVVAYGNRGR